MPSPSPFEPESLIAHVGWVRAVARSLVRDPALADDVSQETLAAAIEHPPEPGRPVRSWLAAIARNVVRQGLRGDSRRARRETAAARSDAAPSAADLVARAAAQRAVVDAVLRLEEPYRATVLLRFFEGLPPRDVAARQGVPVATVHTRLARAFEKLRADLDRSKGGRAAWVALLTPLSLPSAALPIATGAVVVNAKIAWTAAVAAACVAAFFLWPNAASVEATAPPSAPSGPAKAEAVAPAVAKAADAADRSHVDAAEPEPAKRSTSSASRAVAPQAAASKRLRGRVIDTASRAVRGVEIRFSSDRASSTPVATSDDEGRFEIDAPNDGGQLEVASPNYVTVLAGETQSRGARSEPVIVVGPKITVAGVVLDEAGAPVEGASVQMELPDGFRGAFLEVLDFSVQRSWHTKTDARGRFELADVPQVGGGKLETARAGFASRSDPEPAASAWDLSIVLKRERAGPGAWIGRVVDPADRPVAGARVTTGGQAVMTDDAGRFSVPANGESKATLHAVKAGFQPVLAAVSADAAGDALVIRLRDVPLTIRGVVIGPDGKPVPKARVWLDDATWFAGGDSRTVTTEGVASGRDSMPILACDAAGAFVFEGLSARDYRLCAVDERTLRTVKLEGVRAGTQDLRLSIPDGGLYERVAGRVVTRAGDPVAGVLVRPWRDGIVMRSPSGNSTFSSDASGPTAETDADGRFELKRVAREDVHLSVSGDAILSTNVAPPLGDKPEDLRIVVPMRCHMKIELQDRAEAVTHYLVLDGAEKKLSIVIHSGGSTMSSDSGSLVEGVSQVVALDDSARTLVLCKNAVELRRLPLELKPGQTTIVRP